MAAIPELLSAAGYALQFLQLAPALLDAYRSGARTLEEVKGIITATATNLDAMIAEKRPPNDAEWDDMNAMIAELRKEAHAPDAS